MLRNGQQLALNALKRNNHRAPASGDRLLVIVDCDDFPLKSGSYTRGLGLDGLLGLILITPRLHWTLLTSCPNKLAEAIHDERRVEHTGAWLGTFDLALLHAVQICNEKLGRGFGDKAHAYENDLPWPPANMRIVSEYDLGRVKQREKQ